MTEKLYFITAKTKGENPVVLFLSGSIAWTKNPIANPLALYLSSCKEAAEEQPTHCLFVDAKDSLRKALYHIMKSGDGFITTSELKQLIKEHDCHTVSTKKKKEKPAKTEQPEPVQHTPIEQPQKRIGYILVREGSNGKKQYRCDSAVYVMIGDAAADVFMTKEQADFVRYTRNLLYNNGDSHSIPWKVEQIEF